MHCFQFHRESFALSEQPKIYPEFWKLELIDSEEDTTLDLTRQGYNVTGLLFFKAEMRIGGAVLYIVGTNSDGEWFFAEDHSYFRADPDETALNDLDWVPMPHAPKLAREQLGLIPLDQRVIFRALFSRAPARPMRQ